MLTQEKKEYLKDLLIQRLHELLAEVNKTEKDIAGLKDVSPDFLD